MAIRYFVNQESHGNDNEAEEEAEEIVCVRTTKYVIRFNLPKYGALTMKRIAIIGAGPMGLALAFFLGDKYRVTIFEKDDRPGGMSASFDFDGFTIERYYHFVNGPDKYLFDLLQRLDMPDAIRWTSTKMGIFSRNAKGVGELQPWGNPIALLRFKGVPLLTRLRYGLHAFSCKFIRDLTPLDDVSAADWIRRWEGNRGYDEFWRFLFEKKFFRLADPLSAAWIASRIRRVANSRQSLMEEKLGYIEGGSQALIDRLVNVIQNNGGEIRLSSPVERVESNDAGQCSVTSGSGTERFDAVVSTMPLPYVKGMIRGISDAYAEKLDKMLNVGCACALFRLGKPVTDNFWVNVNMPGWDIPGIIEYSNLRPTSASYVYIPFYMPHDHENWGMADDALLEKARSYIRGVNPDAAASEQAVRLFRYQYAQPVCPPGFRHILPPYETGARNVLVADTTHSFPEDRSINESTRIAAELSEMLLANL